MKKILFIFIIVICSMLLVGCGDSSNDDEAEFSEISYNVSDDFERYSEYRGYSYSDDDVYCRLWVNAYTREYYDEDREVWFKSMINVNLNDKVSELKEIDVNGNKALYIEVNDKNDVNYYYGFVSNNYYYLFDYSISVYDDEKPGVLEDNKCYKYINDVINSVKLN